MHLHHISTPDDDAHAGLLQLPGGLARLAALQQGGAEAGRAAGAVTGSPGAQPHPLRCLWSWCGAHRGERVQEICPSQDSGSSMYGLCCSTG